MFSQAPLEQKKQFRNRSEREEFRGNLTWWYDMTSLMEHLDARRPSCVSILSQCNYMNYPLGCRFQSSLPCRSPSGSIWASNTGCRWIFPMTMAAKGTSTAWHCFRTPPGRTPRGRVGQGRVVERRDDGVGSRFPAFCQTAGRMKCWEAGPEKTTISRLFGQVNDRT